jgi:hypothetical protein
MKRAVVLAALGYIAISGSLIYREYANRLQHRTAFTGNGVVAFNLDPAAQAAARAAAIAAAQAQAENGGPAPSQASGAEWFAVVKASCNALEADLTLQQSPPPAGADGAGYGASCLALAGHIDKAAALIDALPADQRGTAANTIFEVGHPVADAGDDASAGPIMGLVVKYLPDHYMALYHAGMAEYGLGESDLARQHLERFIELYTAEDGWRSNARLVLTRLGDRAGP